MNQPSNQNPPSGIPELPPVGERTRPLFSLGQIVATSAVLDHFAEHSIRPDSFLRRHVRGDWGNVPPEDARENDFSVLNGFRVLSSYEAGGKRFWIITEADRSSSCIIFPAEY